MVDVDQSWPSIQFGIDLDLSGSAYVFESGNNRGNFGTYATGDRFQVAIVGGVVKYKKNGTVFYTSSVTPAYPLVVDTSLYSNGSTLSNVVLNSARLQWLVPDHLGTPRMIIDQTGSLTNLKRHDYLPFGEEISAGTGGRTSAMGYLVGDNVRQQFTSKERDSETGLDYFGARYYSSTQGRFTSVDPMGAVFSRQIDPQQLNRYSSVRNNPLRYIDLDGRDLKLASGLKKADQDRIIKRAVNLYRKASGRAAIESMATSDIKFEVGTGNLPSKISLMDRTVKETYGETKGIGFKIIHEPADPSKVISIDRASGVVRIVFDLSKRKDADVSYSAGLSSVAPPSEQHLFDHEFGHADDMNKNMVAEANQSEQQAEQNAEAFANTAEKEKDSLSQEDAEKRVRENFGITPQPEKKKEKKDNE